MLSIAEPAMTDLAELVRPRLEKTARYTETRFTALAARATVALVLAGGRGSRLKQLSDCLNSGIRRIDICTQYKSHSLIRHIQRGWSFLDSRFDEFVEVLPAQQRVNGDWYQGTADAVYQNLDILRRQY